MFSNKQCLVLLCPQCWAFSSCVALLQAVTACLTWGPNASPPSSDWDPVELLSAMSAGNPRPGAPAAAPTAGAPPSTDPHSPQKAPAGGSGPAAAGPDSSSGSMQWNLGLQSTSEPAALDITLLAGQNALPVQVTLMQQGAQQFTRYNLEDPQFKECAKPSAVARFYWLCVDFIFPYHLSHQYLFSHLLCTNQNKVTRPATACFKVASGWPAYWTGSLCIASCKASSIIRSSSLGGCREYQDQLFHTALGHLYHMARTLLLRLGEANQHHSGLDRSATEAADGLPPALAAHVEAMASMPLCGFSKLAGKCSQTANLKAGEPVWLREVLKTDIIT